MPTSEIQSDLVQNYDMFKLRAALKELMYRKNLSPTEFARQAGLPQPTVHRLLVGKTEDPKLSTLSLIASFFSVSIDQLVGKVSLDEPLSHQKGRALLSIPIISWENATETSFTEKLNRNNWDDWFYIDINVSPLSFGLKSKRSMEPRFPTGSILTVDPSATPRDGDLVIVYYKDTKEATVREIILDGRKQSLQHIVENSLSEELTNEIKIIGVIVQTRYSYKE